MAINVNSLPVATRLKADDDMIVVQDGQTRRVKGTLFLTREEYTNDTFTPDIYTTQDKVKLGQGDTVDYSTFANAGLLQKAKILGVTNTQTKQGCVLPQVTLTDKAEEQTVVLADATLRELHGANGLYDEINCLSHKTYRRLESMKITDASGFVVRAGYSKEYMLAVTPQNPYSKKNDYQTKAGKVCDRFKYLEGEKINDTSSSEAGFVCYYDQNSLIIIVRTNLTIDDFRATISEANPLFITFPIDTIVTENVAETPIAFNDGFIKTSSDTHNPIFEYSCSVGRGGQISGNTTTIVRHSQEIAELDIEISTTVVDINTQVAKMSRKPQGEIVNLSLIHVETDPQLDYAIRHLIKEGVTLGLKAKIGILARGDMISVKDKEEYLELINPKGAEVCLAE